MRLRGINQGVGNPGGATRAAAFAGAAVAVSGLTGTLAAGGRLPLLEFSGAPLSADTCVETPMGQKCYSREMNSETKTVRYGDLLPKAGLPAVSPTQGFWVSKVDMRGIEIKYAAVSRREDKTEPLRIEYGKGIVIAKDLIFIEIYVEKSNYRAAKVTVTTILPTTPRKPEKRPPQLRDLDTAVAMDFERITGTTSAGEKVDSLKGSRAVPKFQFLFPPRDTSRDTAAMKPGAPTHSDSAAAISGGLNDTSYYTKRTGINGSEVIIRKMNKPLKEGDCILFVKDAAYTHNMTTVWRAKRVDNEGIDITEGVLVLGRFEMTKSSRRVAFGEEVELLPSFLAKVDKGPAPGTAIVIVEEGLRL